MKTNNNYIIKFLLAVCFGYLLFTSSCFFDSNIHFVNNTNDTLCYFWRTITQNDSFPNTNDCEKIIFFDFNPNSNGIIHNTANWRVEFSSHRIDLLRLYFLNHDSIRKYGECKVMKRQLYIKRLDFTYDDLKRIDWTIVYDGK